MLKPKSFIPVITFVLVMMYGFSGAQELVPTDEMALVIVVVHPEGKPNAVGERHAEEVAGRADARHGCDEGTAVKKMVTPAARRDAVAHAVETHGMAAAGRGRASSG